MGPAYKISRGVETLRIDWYLTLIFLTHGNLAVFRRLMKYVDPLSVRKAHPSLETYSYKCAAGLKTLLVDEVSLSAAAVSEKNLKETAPIVLARWKTTVKKSNSRARILADVLNEMETRPPQERKMTLNLKR